MEGFVAKHVDDYQHGKINRRRLIEILTFAATTAYAGKAACRRAVGARRRARQPRVLHLSGLSPRRRLVLDGVQSRAGRRQQPRRGAPVRQEGRQAVRRHCERRAAHPHHLPHPAAGNGGAGIVAAEVDRGDRPSRAHRRRFRPRAGEGQLTALGVKNVRDGGPYSVYVDDPFGYEIQISGIGVTAVCGAGDRAGCGEKR